MTPRVQRAIDIFLDALNQNLLVNKVCTKCAVGNLVRAGMIEKGVSYTEDRLSYITDENGVSNADWSYLFCTRGNIQKRRKGAALKTLKNEVVTEEDLKKGEAAIAYTEFTEDELAQIEYVFETTGKDVIYREDAIVKLNAVVELMLTFDDCKEKVDEVFTKKAEILV